MKFSCLYLKQEIRFTINFQNNYPFKKFKIIACTWREGTPGRDEPP